MRTLQGCPLPRVGGRGSRTKFTPTEASRRGSDSRGTLTNLARYHSGMYRRETTLLLALLLLSAGVGYYLLLRVNHYWLMSMGPSWGGYVGSTFLPSVTSAQVAEAKRRLLLFVIAIVGDGAVGLASLVGIRVLLVKARKSRQRGFPIEPRGGS
jgi:hypothetical protein